MRVPCESLQEFCEQALQQVGVPPADAHTTAAALVLTDTWGVHTHGTKLLAGYLRRLQGGGWNVRGCPTVHREGPAWAIVDGDHALAQVGGTFAMQTAIDKARACGIAFVGLHSTGHLGAAGYFAYLAAQAGLVGIVAGNDTPSVAAPLARGAVLGSNPLAYCAPARRHPPLLLDMATAAVAGGKIYAARQRGEPIPATWLIGPDGLHTTDANLYPQQAALAPMAGHKGYGIGLLAELLAGVMPGGAITWEIASWIFDPPHLPSRHNAAMLAIDVQTLCGDGVFEQRVDQLIDQLHAAPKAEGADRILVPGELEWERRRDALAQGIPLPPDVLEPLGEIATTFHVPAPWA